PRARHRSAADSPARYASRRRTPRFPRTRRSAGTRFPARPSPPASPVPCRGRHGLVRRRYPSPSRRLVGHGTGLAVRWGIDYQDGTRLAVPRREAVRQVGREEAGVARPELAALAADLCLSASLDDVADLVDAGMAVGQGAMRLADDPEQDLQPVGTG